jgi:L-threonylcarbamoyladenylate synthase
MEILYINPRHPQAELIARAAEVLRSGLPLVFPTDTVYGLGLAVFEQGSLEALFALKRREPSKAIPWLISDVAALEKYAKDLPPWALGLAREHWPGALTLVVRASDAAPAHFVASDGSLALRVPAHPIPLALIEALGQPLATTSANLHGAPAARALAELDPALAAQLSLALDGGPTPGSQPSTLVSCLGEAPVVLREAALLLHLQGNHPPPHSRPN